MKHKHLLEELLYNELDDYSYFIIDSIELIDESLEDEEYEVVISYGNRLKSLYFKVNADKIKIQLTEDSWYEICTYEYTIKYFWMSLLNC